MGNPKSDGKCLLKETHREEDTERRLWRLSQRLVMRPQAEASNLQNPEEAKDGFSPRASRGSMDTPDLGHLISRIVRITFSCFLPPSWCNLLRYQQETNGGLESSLSPRDPLSILLCAPGYKWPTLIHRFNRPQAFWF